MRKLLIAAIIMTIVLGCGRRNSSMADTYPNILDSLSLEAGMGDVVERVYDGVIPAADGIQNEYLLMIYQQEYTNNGVYILEETPAGEENKDLMRRSSGRWKTLLTSSYDIMQLVPFDGNGPEYSFYTIGGEKLEILDKDLNPVAEPSRRDYYSLFLQ